jgi:hypothetical protein
MKRQKFVNLPITRKLRPLQPMTVGLGLMFTLLISNVVAFLEELRQVLVDAGSTANMIGFNAVAALPSNVRAQLSQMAREVR